MLPLQINLLSPDKQNYLKRIVCFQLIKNLLETILIFICLSGIVLAGGKWILQKHFNDLTAQIIAIRSSYVQNNQTVGGINQILKKIENIQDQYIQWTDLMSGITKHLPDSIVLNRLDIAPKQKTVLFEGTAPTRQDLLNLQTSLEQIDWIASAEIPVSQLTKKENINFSITATMK